MAQNLAIERDIVARHSPDREAILEMPANRRPIEGLGPRNRCHRLVYVLYDKAGYAVVPMISGTAPRLNAMTGVAFPIASMSTRPNGSGQSIGNNKAIASP